MKHAEAYFGKASKKYDDFYQTIGPLTATYPHKLAKDFSPSDLKIVRNRMIEHHDWSRRVVNRRIGRIRFIWKWAAEDSLVPASTLHGLLVVSGLKVGKTNAREMNDCQPVPDEVVELPCPTCPSMSPGSFGSCKLPVGDREDTRRAGAY